MIKTLTLLFLVSIITTFSLSPVFAQEPTPTSSPRPTTSYELFWPIVAGRLPDDSLYFLKTLKEKLELFLAFSSSKKANQYLTLSKKRLVESEKLLLEKKDYPLANQTLALSAQYLNQSVSAISSVPSTSTNSELRQTIIREGENEVFFLSILESQIPPEQQTSLTNIASQMQQSLTPLKPS